MTKSDRLYSDSPSVKRDKEGKVGIKRPSQADAEDMGLKGGGSAPGTPDEEAVNVEQHNTHERREVHHKHMKEAMDMHHRHEMEHSSHQGDKSELHAKHEEEHAAMHDRHEAEMKEMHARHGAAGSGE